MSYTTGRVYRIICLSNPEIQYVGSTYDTLRNRLQAHKKSCKNKNISLYEYIKKDPLGWDNYKMVLIKEYIVYRDNVKDTKHLRAYEQLWMNKLKCVNKCFNFVPECVKNFNIQIYLQNNKEKIAEKQKIYCQKNNKIIAEKHKVYFQKNKEIISAQSKVYHQANKDKLVEKRKIYLQNNKGKLTEQQKIYYQNNKKIIAEKQNVYLQNNKKNIICECGSTVVKYNITRHKKSLKHITFINNHT